MTMTHSVSVGLVVVDLEGLLFEWLSVVQCICRAILGRKVDANHIRAEVLSANAKGIDVVSACRHVCATEGSIEGETDIRHKIETLLKERFVTCKPQVGRGEMMSCLCVL